MVAETLSSPDCDSLWYSRSMDPEVRVAVAEIYAMPENKESALNRLNKDQKELAENSYENISIPRGIGI